MRLPLRSIYHYCFSSTPSYYYSPTTTAILSQPLKPIISLKPQKMEFFSTTTATTTVSRRHRRREKVVVIMGPTGSGKSKLSVDLATRFNGEIINSDKIQVYKGLNITTNKIPLSDQLGVTHHLLGEFDSANGELTQSEFRSHATSAISSIYSRRRVPIIAGGSNSFIYALLSDKFNPDNSDVFTESDSLSPELRYKCCFLYIDVSFDVLKKYLLKRVDEMLDSGMLEELSEFYESEIYNSDPQTGLRKAIGVPEFESYFKMVGGNDRVREGVYEEAVRAIKENTCQLAKKQIEKIHKLKNIAGWDLHKLDGSDSFRAVLDGSKGWSEIWERQVVAPSVKIVKHFLEE